jgi:hypothetical protein
MKYLRRHNLNTGNVLDNTVVQTSDGRVEINPSSGQVTINADLVISGAIPGTEVTNVMYVTVDGNDANTGLGEGPTQAKRTIKAAVAAAQEGTTIFVRSGEYYEDNPIRLPPKVSIIGDNLRRTILRPLNGPKKFNVTSISRTNGVVTVAVDQVHELKLHDRVRVIVPSVNVDIECANITEIVNSNQFRYKDTGTDLSFTPITEGTVELGVDFFLVTNQSYIAQLVFRGFQAPGYCLNIDKDAIVDTSPYIQNCSNINGPWLRNGTEWLPFQTEQPDLTGAMVKGPRPLRDDEILPSAVAEYGVNERGAGGGMLIDGDRYNSESPIKSMVADAFTQVAQGAVGFHITNFGYMQLVSCFSVFCDKAFYTTNGGYLSISNSVVDFGNYGFVADGYYPTPYGKGVVDNAYYSTVGSITINNEGRGYTAVPNVIIEPPDILVPGGVTAEGLANIDSIRGTVNAVTIENPGAGYTFVPEVTIDPPFMPYNVWAPNTFYGAGQYILVGNAEYQITIAGTTGSEPPTHSSGSQLNGTAEFTFVGIQATGFVNLATNITVTINDLSEKPQVASIMFIGDNPTGYYIVSTSASDLGFRYNEQKCRRDVGYIVDAVLADLVFGTNFRTIYAGRAYLRSYSSKVLSSQRAQTVEGVNQARLEVKNRISPSNPTLEATVDSLFDIVTNIIQTGDVGASVPVFTTLAGRTPGFSEARNILLANKQFIQDQIVWYINNTLQGFQYDQAKCSRDIEIIVNAVLDDIVFGTNYLTKTAALSYLRSYTNEVISKQKAPTVAGVQRARDIVLKTLQDELDSEVKITRLFDTILNIINDGNATSAPATRFTDPVGVSASIITNARQIESNKQPLINDVITYINDNLNPLQIVGYKENTCRRDVGYILDALIFDVLYGGNSATINVARSFFNAQGDSVISTQISQHVSAFNQLKNLIASIAPGTSTTTNALIDIIINAINVGLVTLPVVVNPTYTNGSLYQYYNDERTRISNSIEDIKTEVIDYINTVFSGNFNYNEATCRRDIDYIIDAIAYDLNYGGTTQTTNAALAYSEGSVISGEIEETKLAYQYWKEILPLVLQNQPVPDAAVGGQVTNLPLGNPEPQFYPSFIAQNLLQIVIDVIDYGTGYVPEPTTESEFDLGDVALNSFRSDVLGEIIDIQDSVINYLNTSYGGNVDVTVFPGIIEIPAGTSVRFHNVSTISTGGTALEYVGSGVTYNALPFFGGEPDPDLERTEINNGRCFTVTNDQVGNFRVGGLFNVNALTGGVTIDANNLNLGGISSIGPFRRNGIPVGVELKEVSNNANLISSLGTQDTNTAPTQQAVATYVENRYLNKVQSIDPQTVASNVTFQQDIAVNGGDLTSTASTFNLLNQSTTVNAFNAAANITIGATSGTLTVRNTQTRFTSTDSIKIPVGTTAQRDNTPEAGQIRYNSQLQLFEGYGPGNAWGSLGGVRDVDGNTYIIPETSPGANENILYFYNNGVLTATLEQTSFNVSNGVIVNINDVTGSDSTLNGALVVDGGVGIAQNVNIGGTLTVTGNSALNGANLTTTQTTFNLLNTTATTINAFGAATNLVLSAGTGTTNIRNNLDVDGDIHLDGGDLTASTSTFNLLNTTVNNLNFANAADTIVIGGTNGSLTLRNSSNIMLGNLEVRGGNITTDQTTFNVINTIATTVNAFGAANSLTLGSTTGTATIRNANTVVTGDLAVNGGDITTTATTFNLVASNATTVNAFGAATTLNLGLSATDFNIGATSGTTNVRNNLDVDGNINIDGGSITVSTGTFNIATTTASTINLGTSALTVEIGAASGTTNINNNLIVDLDLDVRGGDITTNQTTFNLLNATATTVNAFGAASTLNIGATTGTLTVNNQQTVFNSTDSIRLPVGTTLQRDATPEIGQIRYNSELSSFEGFGPGNNWGSLGGVKDVDQDTYILAELTPASDDDTLYFYNGGVETLTITNTAVDYKSSVTVTINNTTNSTSSTTGALVVDGGIGVANDIVGAGWLTSSIQQFEIDEGEY